MSDARHILQNHYKDAARLDARIQLHAKYSTNTQGLHSWVFEHLRLPSTCQVLEVGCGSGQLWLVNHPNPATTSRLFRAFGDVSLAGTPRQGSGMRQRNSGASCTVV